MARIARVVAPGYPHHIIQRGNRRMQTFFCDEDYDYYISTTAEWCALYKVGILSYCLMPNHVHLIAVPENIEGLRRSFGEAHRRYTKRINDREKWKGYLWQGRFRSYILDTNHLITASRYIELNPVRAGLVKYPEQWQWSSAKAHLQGKDDKLCNVNPLLELVGEDWNIFLNETVHDDQMEELRRHERTGRPLGSKEFVLELEKKLKRSLFPKKRGPKFKKPKNN